ncbi:MAG: hypothetical protein JKX85_11105 [Phycisphaeraceae bacterium]|nr:hypothetical protein [Phycisphaeraceae bacterium]
MSKQTNQKNKQANNRTRAKQPVITPPIEAEAPLAVEVATLPVIEAEPKQDATSEATEAIEKEPIPLKHQMLTGVLKVPLLPHNPNQYATNRIDLSLKHTEALGFQMLCLGLKESGARLNNGNYVNTPQDAVRWLMQNIFSEGKSAQGKVAGHVA